MWDYGKAILFAGDDDGYRAWVKANPQGLVVNDFGRAAARLHRVDCWHFFPDRPATGDYPKLAGTSLASFRSADISDVPRCTHCDV